MNDSGTTNFLSYDILLRYIWVPIIVPIILFIIKFVVKDRLLWIKEIKKQTGADAEAFVDLYNARIDESIKICPEEILSYIRCNNSVTEHHLYVCKSFNKTVGFIKFMISKEQKYIFVAYVGIDKNDATARKYGLNKMVCKLSKKYFKPTIATTIFLEIDKTSTGDYLSSLAKLISRYALSIKKETYYINATYFQPKMPDENYDCICEKKMSLIYIPYYYPDNKVIDKGYLIQIIKSIYLNIYQPCCYSLSDNCSKYNEYLDGILKKYLEEYPDSIEIIKI